ncbi:MAG: glutamine-hydrolyzing GMP synthase [Pseudomonadota bacterium]|nr:glutamine-hydrolyzing GMP synthase [Pseudomonadota bacterium]
MKESILIVDFGSQVTKLIARRIRELGVFSRIVAFNAIQKKKIKKENIKGIIFSGGPKSVNKKKSPQVSSFIYDLGIPILGICYGLQLISKNFGGSLKPSTDREFGRRKLLIERNSPLFKNVYRIKDKYQVWMSHSDKVSRLPDSFVKVASSDNCEFAVIENIEKKIFGVQFHPEVVHTKNGNKIIENFVKEICLCKENWNMGSFKNDMIENIKKTVGDKKVICGLSGGVDSTVTAVLIHRAIGKKLMCVFVDTGLMRQNEGKEIRKLFSENFQIKLKFINASKVFFKKLQGITNPEKKRKIIGREFIKIFEQFASTQKDVKFLAQGTLYPDVIESLSKIGKSTVTIKSHHNVGGLPKKLKLELIEPLRELFKDEVRTLGKELDIPSSFVKRHPFPGPGLAIRLLGDITKANINILRKADDIFIGLIKKAGIYDDIWQAFCVLLPVKTVGVMGDERTYEKICVLRAVTSVDGMTAESYKFKNEFIENCANEIINNVPGINRVCYDYTSKPPGTIEFE